MLKKLSLLFVAAALITSTAVAEGNEPQAVKPNYNLAEQFSPAKMRRMVPQTVIRPNWYLIKLWNKTKRNFNKTSPTVFCLFASTAA